MVKNYVEHTIRLKRKYIYLEKGRWVYILLFLFIFTLGNSTRYEHFEGDTNKELIENLSLFFTLIGFLSLLFYAIPVFLKKQRYSAFIIYTIALILCATIVETIVYYYICGSNLSLYEITLESFFYNFNIFTNTTSFAFFIETLDEISLIKESKKDFQILKDSERKLAGTHVNLEFMLKNLSAIKENMQKNDSNTSFSDQLLQLSDVLRYKLYGYDNEYVPIEDEIDILDKIITQKNLHLELEQVPDINWEYDIKESDLKIQKCALVNIFALLFYTKFNNESGNKTVYLLVENAMVNLFIEMEKLDENEISILEKNIYNEFEKYEKPFQVEKEYQEEKVVFNITFNLWKQSNA